MNRRLAAIDIGTNSTKMTVADVAPDGALSLVTEDAEITRLGKGVDATRQLDPAAVERTLDAVARFAAAARTLGAQQVLAAGTSALRDAENGAAFLAAVRARTGIEVEIISGEREARLAYAAVRSDRDLALPADGPLLVFDIGGGSTELIWGNGPTVERHASLDIGAVRLSERFLPSDPPSPSELASAADMAQAALDTFPVPGAAPAVAGLGGTAVNLASVACGRESRDSAPVHGTVLTLADVSAALERLQRVPLAERRQIRGLEPARADVIVAGALILQRLLTTFHADRLTVSTRGLRYGLLAEQAHRP